MGAQDSETPSLRARIEELEAELARSRADADQCRTLIETVPAVVLRISLDGTIEYVNRVLPEYASSPLVGCSIYVFAPSDQHEAMRAALERTTTTLLPSSYESIAEAPDGTRDWYVTTVGPVLEDDRLVGLVLACANASQAKQTEAALVASRAELQMALAAGNVGVWRWDRQSDVVHWDEKLTAMFGLEPEDAPRSVEAYLALMPASQRGAMAAHIERALTTGDYPDFELRTEGPGEPRCFIIKGGIQRGPDGQVTGLMGGVVDITDRRRLEERLYQAHKLQAVGQLAGGVAHNFNNMLAVIVPALELTRLETTDHSLLDDALTAASNAAQLVRQLMVFSRSGPQPAGQRESLAALLRRAVDLCRQTFPPSVRLEVGPMEAGHYACVEAAPMEQAVMNLLLNARDAMTRGATSEGTIELSLRRRANVDVRRTHPSANGDFVELRVRDTGQGMDEATRARMLEPFFSTKPIGRGTGLGLSTAWATVQDHGGFLDCTSEVGVGTTFSLHLPARDTPIGAEPATRAPLLRTGEGRVVLLVDDDKAVRHAVGALLASADFSVLMASGGEEAVKVVAAGRADVVLLDFSMPGLSAQETLRQMRAHEPRLPVICLSGLAVTLEGADAHLIKPVTQGQLVRALHRALEVAR